jgi:hypothetical protein
MVVEVREYPQGNQKRGSERAPQFRANYTQIQGVPTHEEGVFFGVWASLPEGLI